MPWEVHQVEELRMTFIVEWQSGGWSMTELCRQYGIARKTGYKWLERYRAEGVRGLADRPSSPAGHPNAIPAEVNQRVLAARAKHPTWGPRKLRGWLAAKDPDTPWPAVSTIAALLQREGLTHGQRRVRRTPASQVALAPYDGANSVWCADFKGWFRCGDGARCEPFTLLDGSTRYLLRCQAVPSTHTAYVQPLLAAAFAEFGLPQVLRSDNGSPFAGRTMGGLSQLAVWLVLLDVRPERIAPGRPQENGRQERLHRTLKADCAMPPAANLREQQRRFQRFRQVYNQERPHQALEDRTPASVYQPSPRTLPDPLPREPQYPAWVEQRWVDQRGLFRWRRGLVEVGRVLAAQRVGIQYLDPDERYWRLFLGKLPLAVWDEHYATWLPTKLAAEQVARFPEDEPWHW